MKTIGVITYHKSINYGANLQACALQMALTEMGYVPECINYHNQQMWLSSVPRVRQLRHITWRNISRSLAGTEREEKTKEFRSKYLQISATQYSELEALHSTPPQYDAYITGSDQVWNPYIQGNDPSYFLTFAPRGRRRIAYAASFGIKKIPEQFINNYRKWLSRIQYLSTREIEGKEIIKQLIGRDVEVTLDPTLLIDQEQWRQIAIPYDDDKPYILCYYMPGDKVVNRSITDIARQVSTHTGWNVISIGQKEYMRLIPWKRAIFDAGPAEFLGLIQNASFIVTNSFHGTAFSVIYQKPFIVPVNSTLPAEKALHSRITSLLRTIKLEDRLIPSGEGLAEKIAIDMDYEAAELRIQQERQRSIDFLKYALKGV